MLRRIGNALRVSPPLAWLLRLIMAMLLLLLVAWFIDVDKALTILADTDWRFIILACVIVQMQIIVSAWRWQIIAVRLGQLLSLRSAISEYYLATVANLSLPGGVTGDAARVVRTRQTQGWGLAAKAVILERLSGQIALFLIALASWIVWSVFSTVSVPDVVGQLLFTIVLVVAGAGLIVGALIHFAAEPITRFIVSFGPAIHRAWITDNQWLIQGMLSLLVVVTYLAVFAASAFAVGHPLPLIALMTLVPFVLLSMVIPVSIGGWGIREATAASLWPLLSLQTEAGVATSVVYGLVSLLAALPGALCVLLLSKRRAR